MSTRTSRPVATMPSPAKIARKRFLPRTTSEMVPRIGERIATISSEMLSPVVQYVVATLRLGSEAPATLL